MAVLIEVDTRRRHPIGDRVSLGRGPDVDIRLDDPLIATRHAEVDRHADGGWLVRDLGSRHGTYLGSRKIAEARLCDGDELLIGPVRLRFEEHAPRAARTTLRPADDTEIDRLRAVARLSQVIGVEHDLERILDRVLATCLELLPADRAAIVVYDPRSSAPRLTRCRNRSGGDLPFSLSATVLSHVMASQVPFLCAAVDAGEALPRSHSLTAQGVRSLMVVPILYQAEAREWLGLLHLDSRADLNLFTARDLDCTAAIAGQAGLAIKNALLVEQVQAVRSGEWARLERIVRDLPVGVIVLDDRGRCVLASRWVVEHRHLLGEIAPGTTVADIAGVACERLVVRDRPYHIEVGTPPRSLLVATQASSDGREIILVVSDITDERAREARQNHQDRLAIIGQLAGGVAHDFNNLLMVIGTYATFLAEELDEPLRDDARQIGIATVQATDLTRQLLTFSRRETVQPKVVDVAVALERMDKLIRRVLGPQVELVARVDADAPRILADPSQFEQVLMNLLINARDAMANRGRVTLTVAATELDEAAAHGRGVEPGRFLLLEVSDHGSGIAPDVLPRVFDPYFTTKARGKGTGLGLATVHSIVRQAGGDIAVESRLGVGTTFRVHVPETLQRSDDAGATAVPARDGRRTILVVDDDDQVRRLIERMLRRAGYDLLLASSGPEALEVAAAHPAPIDLVLSDLIMPGMSGRELITALAADRPTLALALMSGYHEETLDPAIGFLAKPFDRLRLLSVVADAIAGRDAR